MRALKARGTQHSSGARGAKETPGQPATGDVLRILILEDQVADAELCERELRRAGLEFEIRRVDTMAALEADLERYSPDLVLSDFTFPGGFDGLAALETVQRWRAGVPFIFVSGTIGEERAVEAMRNGAADYVLKDRMARLGPAVRRALELTHAHRKMKRAEAALQESEAKYSTLIDQASDGIFVNDREGSVLFSNSRFREMLGYEEEEMQRLNMADTYPEADRPAFLARIAQLHAVGSRTLERMMLRKDGSRMPVEISIRFLENGTHQGIVRDITARKLQEEKIERLSRIRDVMSQTNAAIVRSRNRQMLFYEACRIAVEHGKFGIAWIGEVDAQKLEVVPVASAGLEDGGFITRARRPIGADSPLGQGVLPRAVRERQPVFSNDITVDAEQGAERRQEAIRRGYRSVAVLPLLMEGEVVATLSIFVKEINFFDQEELKLLTELADHISFALEGIARQGRIDRLSRIRAVTSGINAAIVHAQNPQELFEQACRIAVEQGRLGSAWIGEFDAATLDITPVAWAGDGSDEMRTLKSTARDAPPRGQGAVSRAIRTRQAVHNNDLAAQNFGGPRVETILKLGFRSLIALPLFRDDAVAGTFTLYARETGYFDDEEIALLTELAGNVSFALANMARQRRLEKLSRIRALSSEINSAIVRIGDTGTLLQETCRIAAAHGKFEMIWVGEIDQRAEQVRPAAWLGFSPEAAQAVNWKSITAAQGTLGEAMRLRRAAVRNDIGSEIPVGKLRQEAVAGGYLSTVCLPLVVDDGVVALIVLFAAGRDFFDEDELTLLNELAADVSFAMQAIAQRKKVEYLSYYDALTGLPNRALFMDRAGQQMRSRGGETVMVALILLNIERFRNINDAYGRSRGDELLTLVAQRLEKAFRGKDYIARIGADGFGVVVRGIRDAAAVVHIVENQVLACFRESYGLGGQELRVGAKVGVAMYPTDGEDADALFRNAEAALKKARESGEHYLFYAAEMNARAAQVLSLETRLRTAVEQRQFVLHYQPKYKLGAGNGAICGMEALIRWQEPGGGLVPPGSFIPLLEETGLILEVGKWALERALLEHREWTAKGLAVPRIAVNVSPIQLQQRDFADMVIAAVHDGGDRPEALELEVTESLLMKDVKESIRKLAVLRGVGIHIAMDDFGTGYSSLSYIARLPITSVKIDRSFITGMAASPQDMAIVTTIIALAHSLNLRVVAEGVETKEQAQLLALLKCDEAQGYLYSKPLPAAEIEPLLRPGPAAA